VFSLINGLRTRLLEFVNEFPAGAPNKLIAVTSDFLTEIEAELTNVTDVNRFRLYFNIIEQLSKTLNWLDNAHSAQTPRALVQILERTFSDLFGDGSLFVAPSAEYNYSITDLGPWLRALAKNCLPDTALPRLKRQIPERFYLVQFPRIERENILNHAAFGHEFGHPIADEFLLQHEQEETYQTRLIRARERVERDESFASSLGAARDAVERAKMLSRLSELLSQIHKRGIQELVSDAVGVYLLGPSAAFALMDVLLWSDLDSAPSRPQFYPPSRYRLRLMMKEFDDRNYRRALADIRFPRSVRRIERTVAAVMRRLDEITASSEDMTALQGDPLIAAAYEWIGETIPTALQFARNRVGPVAYSAEALRDEIPALLERLELSVPPNELGSWPNVRPSDWRSTLAASWIYLLDQTLDGVSSNEGPYVREEVTRTLAEKGIEYAILRDDYRQRTQGAA
jgi:hypothetical protein